MEKENVSEFTFHSLRRSSATSAADNGATAQQMTDFYGWKSANMAQEYISTSRMLSTTWLPFSRQLDPYRLMGQELDPLKIAMISSNLGLVYS